MILKEVMIPTIAAYPGMTVREFFAECTRIHTPALPFCDDQGQVTGRVTLKHVLKRYCLPDYLVETAKILGEQVSRAQDLKTLARELLDHPIDTYVQKPHLSLTYASSAVKALALMEASNTSYLFVIENGRYKGVVTMQSMTSAVLLADKE